MKHIKLLPLIAILCFVSGCNNAAKEPVFGTEGDLVTFSEFNNRIQRAQRECVLFGEQSLGDRVLKTTQISTYTRAHNSGSKEKANFSSKNTQVVEEQYDYDTHVIQENINITEESKNKSLDQNGNTKSSQKAENFYQFSPIDGEEYLIKIDNLYKTYYEVSLLGINELETKDDVFDSKMRYGTINEAYSQFMQYYPGTEDTKYYTCHVNNTIYTYIYQRAYKMDLVENDIKQGTTIYYFNRKAQIDFSEGNESIKYSDSVKTETTYTMNVGTFVVDDVVTVTTKYSYECSIVKSDVDLKQINLSKYTLSNII